MTHFRELYWIPLSSPVFFCRYTLSLARAPALVVSPPRPSDRLPPTTGWPSLGSNLAPTSPPLSFMVGFDCQTGLAALMHLSVRRQTPADLSKFLLYSPEPPITSLASPEVEGMQDPIRIHPEKYMVTVTVQKNKLHGTLGEGGNGESKAQGRAGMEGQGGTPPSSSPPPSPPPPAASSKAHEDKTIQLCHSLQSISGPTKTHHKA